MHVYMYLGCNALVNIKDIVPQDTAIILKMGSYKVTKLQQGVRMHFHAPAHTCMHTCTHAHSLSNLYLIIKSTLEWTTTKSNFTCSLRSVSEGTDYIYIQKGYCMISTNDCLINCLTWAHSGRARELSGVISKHSICKDFRLAPPLRVFSLTSLQAQHLDTKVLAIWS